MQSIGISLKMADLDRFQAWSIRVRLKMKGWGLERGRGQGRGYGAGSGFGEEAGLWGGVR